MHVSGFHVVSKARMSRRIPGKTHLSGDRMIVAIDMDGVHVTLFVQMRSACRSSGSDLPRSLRNLS